MGPLGGFQLKFQNPHPGSFVENSQEGSKDRGQEVRQESILITHVRGGDGLHHDGGTGGGEKGGESGSILMFRSP